MGRPNELRHLTYERWQAALDSAEEMRDRLSEVVSMLDRIGRPQMQIENPSREQFDDAVRALEGLPDIAEMIERELSPGRVELLLRRLARLRGVKADAFAKAAGRDRFGRVL